MKRVEGGVGFILSFLAPPLAKGACAGARPSHNHARLQRRRWLVAHPNSTSRERVRACEDAERRGPLR